MGVDVWDGDSRDAVATTHELQERIQELEVVSSFLPPDILLHHIITMSGHSENSLKKRCDFVEHVEAQKNSQGVWV